jgi:hypothetical protein
MTSDEFGDIEQLDENLRKWFKEKWVRFGPDGKIRGACARGDDSEGKPKCLPQSKAHSIGKKGRKYAGAKKRREDPNPERSGKAKNVATKKKTNEDLTEGFFDLFKKKAHPAKPTVSKEEFEKKSKTWKNSMVNAYRRMPELIRLNQWAQIKSTATRIKNGIKTGIDEGYITFETPEKADSAIKRISSALNVKVFDEVKVNPENFAGGGTGALLGLALAGPVGGAIGGALGGMRKAGKLSKQELAIANAQQQTNTKRQDNKEAVIQRIENFEPTFIKIINLPTKKISSDVSSPKSIEPKKVERYNQPDRTNNKADTDLNAQAKNPNKNVNPELQKRLAARKAGKPTYGGGLEEGRTKAHQEKCPECGGPMYHESMMTEKQDACYHKVKSRYKVWPSAYASGALVQCRKKGASNWGTGGKKDESSIMKGIVDEAKAKQYVKPYNNPQTGEQIGWVSSDGYHKKYWQKFAKDSAIKHAKLDPEQVDEACWKGYHKEGNKKMFGKTYPNCVKNTNEDLSQADVDGVARFADKLYKKLGIDVTFTKHFMDRVNDKRNGKPISGAELVRLFKKEYERWGKDVAQMGPDMEGTFKDLTTDINLPFVLRWDRDEEELDLVAKTVMRKKNFKTDNQEFPVDESEEQLDEKCWDTHKQVGMKNKSGRQVPNCVPKESAILKGFKSL